MKEERLLSQEVEALDHRFDSWFVLSSAAPNALSRQTEAPRSQRIATSLPSARDVTNSLPPDVAAFQVGGLV